MRLDENPESNAKDYDRVIMKDPALSFRVLKVINSSFYGMSRKVGSVKQAVCLLGGKAIMNIAIAGSVHKLFQADQLGTSFCPLDLWIHSIAVATGAREIASKTGSCSTDEAFLAGMIHDLGIMVEIQVCRAEFVKMVDLHSMTPGLTFCQAEEQVLGATHEQFGAGLCRKWKLPERLEYAAGFHHQPMRAPQAEWILPAVVHVADVMAARIGAGCTCTVPTKEIDSEVLEMLNLCESDLEQIAETLPSLIQESQQLRS